MLRKLITVLVPLIAVLAIAPAAGAKAKTELSIYPMPGQGVFGFVKSKKPRLCAKNREVVVWKVVDGKVSRVGKGRATRRTGGFTWSVMKRKASTGTIVARTAKKAGCGQDKAKRWNMPKAGDYPACPSYNDICHLERIKIEDLINPVGDPYCTRWMPESIKVDLYSECKAEITKGPIPYCCWDWGEVSWARDSWRDEGRSLKIQAGFERNQYKPFRWSMEGRLPKSNSARWTITRAVLPYWADQISWFTPDFAGKEPGTMGGPIYFNIEPGAVRGFDIYIGGFLFRRFG